jgi:hypothetical protein
MARLTRKKPKRKPKKASVIAAPPATPPSNPSSDAGDLHSHATHKIFPRNLTAQAAYLVPGNPAITRPEDAVANCFPGLEINVRNLDRRFFPGLVFDFVENGARLMYVDVYEDPDTRLDTPEAQNLYFLLSSDDMQSTLTHGVWFLDWIEQAGKKISMHWKGQPVADTVSWRIVRSLQLGPVKICLRQRDPDDTSKLLKDGGTVTLEGWRRRFTDPETGVISSAYKPGELLQGLCSPWQHDFRDCSCFYWAANHPDIVLAKLILANPSLRRSMRAGSPTSRSTGCVPTARRHRLQKRWRQSTRTGRIRSIISRSTASGRTSISFSKTARSAGSVGEDLVERGLGLPFFKLWNDIP